MTIDEFLEAFEKVVMFFNISDHEDLSICEAEQLRQLMDAYEECKWRDAK